MDVLPDWAAHYLSNHPNAPSTLQQYLPYAQVTYTYISLARTYISLARTYLFALLDQVSRKPDLATIALLLIILFISLKLLNMLWQTFIFWFNLARKLVFWGGLVCVGLWMYTRGLEGVQEDVAYWVEVWGKEREYWRERERAARMGNAGMGGAGGRGRGQGPWF